MSVKSKDELLSFLKEKTKDDTSDETLGFIEDITDTFNDYDTKLHDQTDWHQKYTDNDKQWRQKYKERFFEGGKQDEDEDDHSDEDTEPKTFDDLFTIK